MSLWSVSDHILVEEVCFVSVTKRFSRKLPVTKVHDILFFDYIFFQLHCPLSSDSFTVVGKSD